MKKLSVRKLDTGAYEVGPRGNGPSVVVSALSKAEALVSGKARLRQLHPGLKDKLQLAAVAHDTHRTVERMKWSQEQKKGA
jgi:hypothetical protein